VDEDAVPKGKFWPARARKVRKEHTPLAPKSHEELPVRSPEERVLNSSKSGLPLQPHPPSARLHTTPLLSPKIESGGKEARSAAG